MGGERQGPFCMGRSAAALVTCPVTPINAAVNLRRVAQGSLTHVGAAGFSDL
jgi:hypothetical protein